MGMMKNRKFKDPAEAEEIKKWQEYTEEQYKADLNDLDNHDGVVTHLEPDILECEVNMQSPCVHAPSHIPFNMDGKIYIRSSLNYRFKNTCLVTLFCFSYLETLFTLFMFLEFLCLLYGSFPL